MHPSASSRRTFLRAGAGLGVYASLTAALAAASSGDDYWQAVRGQFPFDDSRVPMNAANLCPSPTAVALRVAELTRDIDIDCSFQNREKFKTLLEESRSKAAAQVGVSPNEIALVRNTSEANNTINNGLPLRTDDEIVLWSQNHPTNHVAWEVRAKRFGYKITKVDTPSAPRDEDDLIRPFEKALASRPRVLALTHASNVSGVRLPIRKLADLAHSRGAHVHLDGAQTWGALDVNLPDLGCDSYAASAHKWFMGPKEVGLLYVREDLISEIWPNVVAPGWGDGPETVLEGARKLESMGQRDDAALTSIAAAVDFHRAIGAARIQRRLFALAARLKSGLREIGARLVTPHQAELSAGVCIIEVPAENRTQLLDQMYAGHGIAASTSGGFRLCPHIYNTEQHVDRAVAGLKALRRLWS